MLANGGTGSAPSDHALGHIEIVESVNAIKIQGGNPFAHRCLQSNRYAGVNDGVPGAAFRGSRGPAIAGLPHAGFRIPEQASFFRLGVARLWQGLIEDRMVEELKCQIRRRDQGLAKLEDGRVRSAEDTRRDVTPLLDARGGRSPRLGHGQGERLRCGCVVVFHHAPNVAIEGSIPNHWFVFLGVSERV